MTSFDLYSLTKSKAEAYQTNCFLQIYLHLGKKKQCLRKTKVTEYCRIRRNYESHTNETHGEVDQGLMRNQWGDSRPAAIEQYHCLLRQHNKRKIWHRTGLQWKRLLINFKGCLQVENKSMELINGPHVICELLTSQILLNF